jgi:histidyl-tRNA synthetase
METIFFFSVRELRGPAVPAVGFAVGLERIALMLPKEASLPLVSRVYMAAFGTQAAEVGFVLLDQLRRDGIAADMDFRASSLKAHLRQADRLGALYAILLGEDEAAKGSVTIRNMHTKEQEEISFSALPSVLLSRLTGQT